MNAPIFLTPPTVTSPGPWTAEPTGEVKDARGNTVAHVMRFADLGAIAAALDLLRAAQDFDEVLAELGKHCECGEADCRTTRLRSALARAAKSRPDL